MFITSLYPNEVKNLLAKYPKSPIKLFSRFETESFDNGNGYGVALGILAPVGQYAWKTVEELAIYSKIETAKKLSEAIAVYVKEIDLLISLAVPFDESEDSKQDGKDKAKKEPINTSDDDVKEKYVNRNDTPKKTQNENGSNSDVNRKNITGDNSSLNEKNNNGKSGRSQYLLHDKGNFDIFSPPPFLSAVAAFAAAVSLKN